MLKKWARAVGLFEVISGGTILAMVVVSAISGNRTMTSLPIFFVYLCVHVASIIGGVFLFADDPSGVPISFFVQIAQVIGLKTPTFDLTLWGILSLPFTIGMAPGRVDEGTPLSLSFSINILAVGIAVFLLWYWDHGPKRPVVDQAH